MLIGRATTHIREWSYIKWKKRFWRIQLSGYFNYLLICSHNCRKAFEKTKFIWILMWYYSIYRRWQNGNMTIITFWILAFLSTGIFPIKTMILWKPFKLWKRLWTTFLLNLHIFLLLHLFLPCYFKKMV